MFACLDLLQVLNSFDEELGAYAVEDLTASIQHLNGAFKAMDGNETADSNFDLGVEFDGTFRGLDKTGTRLLFLQLFSGLFFGNLIRFLNFSLLWKALYSIILHVIYNF